GKGRALYLWGAGAVQVPLTGQAPGIGQDVRGFSLQLAIRPDENINQGTTASRYLLHAWDGRDPYGLDLVYEVDDTVQMSFWINGSRVRLGKSPTLPRGRWTQIAYTWDGITGTFAEYVNGMPTGRPLPVIPGHFRLGNGYL